MAWGRTPPRLATDPSRVMTPPDLPVERSEADRYDRRAGKLIEGGAGGPNDGDGAAGVPLALRAPYLVFEAHVRTAVRPGSRLLDLCCGTGKYSLTGAESGAEVTASDLAPNNLVLAHRRAIRAGRSIRTVAADAQQLPFADAAFDVVTCVGSLSYVELSRFLGEVRRVLRPGGHFVCVDSLNHNPVYRLNRWVQYRRGRRGRSTLERMPTRATIAALEGSFDQAMTSYHGVIAFLAPLATALVGERRSAALLEAFDRRFPALGWLGFKFVFSGRKPKQ